MSDAAGSACPTCGTGLPPGAFRCPGCGRVLGEENRCPHCHAVAGVLKRGSLHLCAACGARRELGPGTVILEDLGGGARLSNAPAETSSVPAPQSATSPTPATPPPAPMDPARAALAATRRAGIVGRGSALALRALGILAIGGAIAGGALMAVVVPGAGGLVLAGAAGLLGLGGGTLAFLRARKGDRAAERARRATLEQAVIAAAASRDGSLTATEAAVALGVSLAEADALLTSMADGTRVSAEIDPEGIVRFEFRELRPRHAAQPVRVETAPATEGAEPAEAEVGAEPDEARKRLAR